MIPESILFPGETKSGGSDGLLNLIEHLDGAGANLTTFAFTEYDANSRIKQRITTRNVAGLTGVPAYLSEAFDYDQDGQLLRVNINSGADAATAAPTDLDNYRYDEAGNRVLADEIAFTSGLENRLLSDSEFTYIYDDQGRLIKKIDSSNASNYTDYTWDHRGLLLKAQRFGADPVTVEYGYDVSGRRTARKVGSDQTVTHYDGQNRLAEFNESGDIVRHYLNGTGPNEVLAVDQAGETAWAFADQLGSVATWGVYDTGTSAWSLEHQSFDAFGNLDGATTSILVNPLPQIWAGHHFEITLDLYHMQTRWYDPRSGQFLKLDDTRFRAGDPNLYRYVGNDPVNAIDPTGTEEFILNLEGYNPNAEFDRQLASDIAFIESQQFFASAFDAHRSEATRIRLQARNLIQEIGGATFTFDELQDSPTVRLVRNPNTNVAFNIIPLGISKGRDRFITDFNFGGDNFKIIFRPSGFNREGIPLASIEAVRFAIPGAANDQRVAQEFFDRETAAFTNSSVNATINSTLLALDAVLLGRASVVAPKSGPGQFGRVIERMSDRAARYQSRISGRLPDVGYTARGVKFDGFDEVAGVLLDAKGPGYATFVRNGQFRSWFRGADGLVEQARRQLEAAGGTRIQWHFAEEAAAEATRNLLRSKRITGIDVIFTP